MKTNITLQLDSALLWQAKILAAAGGTSLEDWLTAHIEQIVWNRKTYSHARDHALARLRKGLNLRWASGRSRDELHER